MSKNLDPGTTIPDFRLPDDGGVQHSLSELQGDDAMVLLLGRGEHCPRERMHQREMVKFHEWCDLAFTRLVSILPNELHDVYKLRISSGAHWPFLADAKLEVRDYFEIDEYTDTHHDNAVVPHTLVLSPGLVIEKVYVGYWFDLPAVGRPRGGARAHEGGLRPDDGRGAREVRGEPERWSEEGPGKEGRVEEAQGHGRRVGSFVRKLNL
jgi:peroxiredoxin